MSAHPIVQAEIRHQQRSVRPVSRWQRWLSRGLYLLALVVACIAYFGEWAGTLLLRDTAPIRRWLGLLPGLLILYGIVLQIMVTLRTLVAAANSISRETNGANWDMLVLTGVSGWWVVGGKWWATLRATRRDWLLLLPIRVGLVTVASVIFSRDTVRTLQYFEPGTDIVPPGPLGLLLLVPVLALMTFANAAVITAIGVLAAASVRRAVMALVAGIVLIVSTLALIVMGGLTLQRFVYEAYQMGDIDGYSRYVVTLNLLNTLVVTAVDNGTTLSFPLVAYRLLPAPVDYASAGWRLFDSVGTQPDREPVFWLSLLLSLVGAALLVGLLLWLAQRALVRRGALPASRQGRGR